MTRLAAGRATAWSAIDIGSRQLIQLVVAVFLARLLTPEDFGAVAILAFFSSLVTVVVHSVLGTALIQQRDSSVEQESVVFWLGLIVSAAIAGLFVAIGPSLARFYEIPELALLLAAAGAQVILLALGMVQSALLNRDLRFAELARIGIVASIGSGLVSIVLALWGAGVWALAAQMVMSAAISSLMLWWRIDWRPQAHFRLGAIGGMLRFSSWLSLSSILEVFYTQGFALWVGKLYGARDLGFYNRAATTQALPGSIISAVIGRVSLPMFAARADDPEALRRGLLSASRLIMLVNVPLLAGLALTADLVLLVMFGPQWREAAPLLAILAWSAVVFPLHVLNLQLLLAKGRTDTFFRVEIAKKVVGVASLIVGSLFGIIGLAWAQLFVSLVALVINIAPVARAIDCGVWQQLRNVSGIFAATAVMVAVVLSIRSILSVSVPLELAIVAITGAGAYLASAWLFHVRAFGEVVDMAVSTMATRQLRDRAPQP